MSPWCTADISLIEAFGDVGTPYGEIETVFYLDDFGPMFGNDQDADMLYSTTIGQMILGVPADAGSNEPILNIVPHTAGVTYSADPATVLDATHPTVIIWDSGVTDLIAFYNDDTLSHILSEVAGGVEVDIGLWLGDATGDQAKLRIYGYDETAAAAAYYTIGTHDDGNNLLSLQIGLLTTTAATRNLVICDRGDTPALNVDVLNTVEHAKISVWDSGATDWIALWNDDSVGHIQVYDGADQNLQIFIGDTAGDVANVQIVGYGRNATATQTLYLGGGEETTSNHFYWRIGVPARVATEKTHCLVVQQANTALPATNALDYIQTVAHPIFAVFDSGNTDAIVLYNTDAVGMIQAIDAAAGMTLSIQGISNTIPGDVQFFAGQSDPGTTALAAGTVPEIRIYGWDHEDSALNQVILRVLSVEEGIDPTDDEMTYFNIAIDNTSSRMMIITDDGAATPEITVTASHPTLRIYDSGNTDYLQVYDDDAAAWIVANPNPINIAPSNDVADYIQFDTKTNIPGFTSIGDCDMDIQNQAAARPYDVTFFANQTVPAATPLGGSTPEFRIYGWSSATINTQVYSAIWTGAVPEGHAETNNEIGVMWINPANNYLMIANQGAAANMPEITAAATHATLRIYDSGWTDYIQVFNDDTNAYIQTNANPLFIEPTGGVTRFQDLADANDSDYLVITVVDAQGFVLLEAEPSGIFRFQDVGDSDASDIFQIEVTDGIGYTKLRDETGIIRFDDLDDADDSDYLEIVTTDGTGEVLLRVPSANTLVLQGAAVTAPGDVEFFSKQTDPASAAMAAGEVPEIRIYGWDHADSALNQVILRVLSVEEGIDPTDDEMTYFNIAIDNTSSRMMIITDDGAATPEITVTASHPTLRIYDSGNTDYIHFYDDDAAAWIVANPNPINIAPSNDVADYIQFSTQTNVPGFTSIGDCDLSIQNQAATNPFDVLFFASQTDPGTAAMAAGEVPEIRIYGWDHADTALRYVSLGIKSVIEGQDPDDDEMAYFMVGLDTNASRYMVLADDGDNIQITTAAANPTLRIYAANATDFVDIDAYGFSSSTGIFNWQDSLEILPKFTAIGAILQLGNTINDPKDYTFRIRGTVDDASPDGGNVKYTLEDAEATTNWTASDGANTPIATNTDEVLGVTSLAITITNAQSAADTVRDTTTYVNHNWSGYDRVGFWYKFATANACSVRLQIQDGVAGWQSLTTLLASDYTVDRWYYVELDISGLTLTDVDGYGFEVVADTGGNTFYFDQIEIYLSTAEDTQYMDLRAGGSGQIAVSGGIDLELSAMPSTTPGDVTFFQNQTDPGTAAMAAGEVPEIRIYGWDHADSALNQVILRVVSVEEGIDPTDDEMTYFNIAIDNTSSRMMILTDDSSAIPEITVAASHPTLRIYDSGNTDYIEFYNNDTVGIISSPQPIAVFASGITADYLVFQTVGAVPGFYTVGSCDLAFMNGQNAAPFDVTFFDNQTVPAATPVAGSTPEIRIYGWNCATVNTQVYTGIGTFALREGTAETGNERAGFRVAPANNIFVIQQAAWAGAEIEHVGAMTNPSLFIYDAGGTDYIQMYDDDAAVWIVANPNPINIAPSNEVIDYIQFSTQTNVPGFTSIGDCDLSIQNQAAANPFDVMFFASQTVPAATPAAGSTPEIRIYGWSSATINTQVYSAIWTGAVPEGHAETNTEIGVMHIQPANNYLIITDQDVGVGLPEITIAGTHPTIRIYDGAATPADYIQIYQQDASIAVIQSTQPVGLLVSGDADNYIIFQTASNIPGFYSVLANMDIQNAVGTAGVIYDVTFFANQSDPGTGVLPAGSVPEMRIYGWDHADTALQHTVLRTSSVAETVDPTDDEHSFFMIGVDPDGSRNVVICDHDETTIEFTAVSSHPTLMIYDAGATDYIRLFDDGSVAYIETNANPIYLLSETGVVRFRDADDTDNTLYLEISTPTDGTYVQLIESGNSLMTQMLVLGFVDSRPTVSGTHGAEIHGFTGVGAGAAGKGRLTTGAGTISYFTITGATDETNHVTLGFDVPDLAIDTGTAADFTIEVEFDPAADGDKFDIALLNSVYGFIGTQVITASGAGKQWSTVFNVGALSDTGTFAKGDSLMFYITKCTNGARDSGANCDFYRIRMRTTVGIEIDTA